MVSCRILLFDEATSALDSSTEQSILDTLQRLGQGRTTLFVAHRLSTAARCTQVRMQPSLQLDIASVCFLDQQTRERSLACRLPT